MIQSEQNNSSGTNKVEPSVVKKSKYAAPEDYKTIIPDSRDITAFSFDTMKATSPTQMLLKYGKIKRNKTFWSDARPYGVKTNIVLKMILYAWCEIVNTGFSNPGKQSIMDRIDDHYERYTRLIYEMFKHDVYFQNKKNLVGEKKNAYSIRLRDYCYSEFSTSYYRYAYLELESVFWNTEAKRYKGKWVHNLRANKEGKRLAKAFVQDKILF